MSAGTATCVGTIRTDLTVAGDRVYDVKYRVQTTDRDDQGITAIQAIGIPSIGQFYQVGNNFDAGAFVRSYSANLESQEGSGKVWAVVVNFSSAGETTDPTGQQGMFFEFPWQQRSELSGSGVKNEELSLFHFPNPSVNVSTELTNSVGRPFDDEYTEYSHFNVTIRKKFHYNAFSPNGASDYVDCVNSATFFGGTTDYFKMSAPRWQLLYTGQGLPYWDVTFDFEGKRDGWNEILRAKTRRKIDEGYYYRDRTSFPGATVITRATDDWLHPITGKARLDGTGGIQEWDDTPAHYPPDGINKYLRKNFGDLGIPINVQDILNGK